jgi:hypothetical protein
MKNNRVTILLISTLLLFVGFVAFRGINNQQKTKKEVQLELDKLLNEKNPDFEGAQFFLDQELKDNSNISDDPDFKKKLMNIQKVIEFKKKITSFKTP